MAWVRTVLTLLTVVFAAASASWVDFCSSIRLTNNYAAVSEAAKGHMRTIGTVDLRYPNGFALRPRAAGQS